MDLVAHVQEREKIHEFIDQIIGARERNQVAIDLR